MKKSNLVGLPEQYRALLGKPELTHQMYDLMPIPINIFAPDGTAIFVNRASMDMVNCTDANLLVGKYNLKDDPVCLKIIGQEAIDRIFRGEAVLIPDFPAPIRDVARRGVIDEKPWEAALMDLFCLPIWDGGVFICTICFFTVKNTYEGRADVAKAKAYIREHWREKFDFDALVAAAGTLSGRQFRRVFEAATDKTPLEYYQKVKLEKIQEHLLGDDCTVEQAFTVCGVAPYGTYRKLFKEKTGMTPTEYRKQR